jgi:hypothetical protein
MLLFMVLLCSGCNDRNLPITRAGNVDKAADTTRAGISLSASSIRVPRGETVTLMWHSSAVRDCKATGDWQGQLPTRGTRRVMPRGQRSTYGVHCRAGRRTYTDSLTVAPVDGDAVAVSLTAEPEQVDAGEPVTLRWSSELAMQCTAGGDWLGDQPLAGALTLPALMQTSHFSLTCQTGNRQVIASVTVPVDTSNTLRWKAPTRHTDGRDLTTLSGYRIVWGERSGEYTQSITIDDPNATQWQIAAPPGRYFFAMTALDKDRSESGYSNEVAKTVIAQPPAQRAAVAESPAIARQRHRPPNGPTPPTITTG